MKDRKKHEKQLRLKAKKDAEKAKSNKSVDLPTEEVTTTKKPKGFLAKQMEELFNPKPIDFDPADQEISQFSTQKTFGNLYQGSDDSEAEDIDDDMNDGKESISKSSLKSAPEQKLRLRADIALFDGKYAGKKASRRDLQDSDQEDDSEDASEDDSEYGESPSQDSGDEDDDLDQEIEDQSDKDDEKDIDSDDDEQENRQVDDEDADYGFSNFMNTNTEALHQIEKELEEEELNATSTFHQTATKDVEKAAHVRNQMAFWDEFVDVRIRLQKALTIANKFPQENVINQLKNTSNGSQVMQLAQESLNNTFTLLDSLYECRQILTSGNQELPAYPKKRLREDDSERPDHDKAWEALHKVDQSFEPYMNESIDRWNRKTQIFSGDITGKKLKSMNQTILKQVEFLMADKERLIKRTQLKRSGFRVIGKPVSKSTVAQVQNEEEEYDEEIFDDTDFYSQILKELIERKTGADSSDPIALSRQYLNMMQMKGRNRKSVDRRASKGRKIRFIVHEKLVSFMAPLNREYPPVLDDLCSNLFGKGPSAPATD
eukprot:TRINITY_DN19972_c0_g1_i1.p1 TRINITY_DN19972_c0_g1~~TRINITY_DN19972_c0_g1_i1.p1  ORF type:complete len:545 (+),score=166.36 TRINITY_DN19972_c0_g1_i1:51-1685(+)